MIIKSIHTERKKEKLSSSGINYAGRYQGHGAAPIVPRAKSFLAAQRCTLYARDSVLPRICSGEAPHRAACAFFLLFRKVGNLFSRDFMHDSLRGFLACVRACLSVCLHVCVVSRLYLTNAGVQSESPKKLLRKNQNKPHATTAV